MNTTPADDIIAGSNTERGDRMKRKEITVRIAAALSAVCFSASALLYFLMNLRSIFRLLPSKRNITEEEALIMRDIGYPTWVTYLLTYFLMLFMVIGVVALWFAVVNPKKRGSSVAMLCQLISLGFLALLYKDMRAGKSKFLYDEKRFIIIAALLALSFLILLIYAIMMFRKENGGEQKPLEQIEKERAETKISVLDLCTLTVGDIDFSPIEKLGETEYHDILTREEIIEKCRDSDVILCNKAVIDAGIMDACPRLKYIGLFATGYNNIDVKAAAERGITVCNAPGYSTDSVAQLVFAYILNHATSLDKYNESTRSGEWVRSRAFSYFPYPISELAGKTLCIIGYGAIGRKVAKIADAFGMKICVNTRTRPSDCPYQLVGVDEAFERADYLTVHCPLTDQTKGLISAERLGKMKPTAYVINTARGAVADEDALRRALDDHVIAGAACDVLTVEPMREDDPLTGAENLTLTPHVAWASFEARKRLINLVASNLRAFQNGLPVNTVK